VTKPFDINAAINEHFAYVMREPRFRKQRAIEEAITVFVPDCDEACEILDSLQASLERSERVSVEAEDAYKAYRKALEDHSRAEAQRHQDGMRINDE
jgi:hypothetical protein